MVEQHAGVEARCLRVECRGPHTVIGGKSDDIDGRDATSSQPGAEQDRFVCWRAAVKPGVARRRAPLEEEFIDGDVEAVVELRTGGSAPQWTGQVSTKFGAS